MDVTRHRQGVAAPRLAAAVLAVVALTGCGPVRSGEPCPTVGAEARGRGGGYYVCKPPRPSDPTGTPRWRSA